ncbi:hypothetical protein SAMN05661080_01325 [Modestobacter sp. DSM 44400]|uniref:hypothetical protein n=1 Tax=Modestobacter sp. DSM 44400 TaxID=1550230 RepID=UPI0008981BA5|nr:hypothetical protein [Modestobacter sp. DSM 44400]SDX82275.1 hypothetical protein SAMN05661080_01325 [Modestobacter sp. DSM 44400]
MGLLGCRLCGVCGRLGALVARELLLVLIAGGCGVGVRGGHRRLGGAQLRQELTDARGGVAGGLLRGTELPVGRVIRLR